MLWDASQAYGKMVMYCAHSHANLIFFSANNRYDISVKDALMGGTAPTTTTTTSMSTTMTATKTTTISSTSTTSSASYTMTTSKTSTSTTSSASPTTTYTTGSCSGVAPWQTGVAVSSKAHNVEL